MKAIRISIWMDLRELKINDENGIEIVHMTSQVPGHKGKGEEFNRFNRLREVVIHEWIEKCSQKIKEVYDEKVEDLKR